MVVVGLLIAIAALSVQSRPRDEFEDDLSWAAWSLGMALVGAGLPRPFERWFVVAAAALVTPPIAFVVLFFVYWTVVFLIFG